MQTEGWFSLAVVYQAQVGTSDVSETGGLQGMRLRFGVWSTVLILLAVLAVPSYSGLRDGAFKVQSVDMDGLSEGNTVAFVYGGRFVLVAPHESAIAREFITADDIDKLTNNYLNIIDTKISKESPESPRRIGLGNCYYPTKVVVDEKRELAVVRATALKKDPETGELLAYQVMVAVHLHLTDGKADATGQPVIIKIPGLNGEDTNSEAPGDMYLSNGKLMFSTGRHVCVFDLDEGNLNTVEIIPQSYYGPEDYASFGGFDEATQVLTVARNMSAGDSEKGWTHTTTLRFYKLKDDGSPSRASSLPLITGVDLTGRDYLPPDSEVAIQGMPDDSSEAQSAFFVTNNGNLCLVDLTTGSLVAEARKLGQFPSLAQGNGEAGPRIVRLDPSTRTVFAFKPGPVQLNIRRPVFGRPTRSAGIRRPVFVRSDELGTIGAAKLSSKSKIVSVSDLSYLMASDVSVSGLVKTVNGRWIFAASNGEMFIAGVSDSGEAKGERLGDIGHPRVESVAYNDERDSIVALCSSGKEGEKEEELPGAVVIAQIKEGKSSPVAFSIVQMLSPSAPGLGSVITSIRRPCNLGR
jgi:hypothetical protein